MQLWVPLSDIFAESNQWPCALSMWGFFAFFYLWLAPLGVGALRFVMMSEFNLEIELHSTANQKPLRVLKGFHGNNKDKAKRIRIITRSLLLASVALFIAASVVYNFAVPEYRNFHSGGSPECTQPVDAVYYFCLPIVFAVLVLGFLLSRRLYSMPSDSFGVRQEYTLLAFLSPALLVPAIAVHAALRWSHAGPTKYHPAFYALNVVTAMQMCIQGWWPWLGTLRCSSSVSDERRKPISLKHTRERHSDGSLCSTSSTDSSDSTVSSIGIVVVPHVCLSEACRIALDECHNISSGVFVFEACSTVEQILSKPSLCRQFTQHCQSEFSSENILFLREVHTYITSGARFEAAKRIYETYIKPSAVLQVNLSDDNREKLMKYFEKAVEVGAVIIEEAPADIFNEAYREIKKLVERDSIPRFRSRLRSAENAQLSIRLSSKSDGTMEQKRQSQCKKAHRPDTSVTSTPNTEEAAAGLHHSVIAA